MSWANPALLVLLALVPLAAAGAALVHRARRRALEQFAAVDVLRDLIPPGALRARAAAAVLGVLALLGLALAAAGPRLGFAYQQQKLEGVSIVVVLDVSRSMDAQDVQPSRMEAARRELVDLVALMRGDAIGLVVFAAGAYTRIPPTVDTDTFLWAVDDSDTTTVRAQGSSLAGALDSATQLLTRADGSGKAILVVSDGEAHDGEPALDASIARARSAGIRIYALGVGTPDGAPMPLADGGFKKDALGQVVLSRLDEARLQRLASETGGAYVRSVVSDDDVRALYQDEIRGALDAASRGTRREKVWHERFQWPLAVALVAMVAGSALGIARRASVRAAVLLLALSVSRPAFAGAAEDGMDAWKAQRWEDAVRLLGRARVEDPSDVSVMWALAESLYRSGRYREAEGLYESLAAADPERRAKHLYNAGNAAYKGGRLEEAARDFDAAAKADPTLASARANADTVRAEIRARLNEDPQEPPPQDGASDEDAAQGGQGAEQGGAPDAGQDGQDGQADGASQGEQGRTPGQDGRDSPGSPSAQDGAPPSDGTRDASPTRGDERGDPSSAGGPSDGATRAPPGTSPAGEDTPEGMAGTESGAPSGAESGVSVDAADGTPTGDGMSAAEAAKLVESVPDGKPRVVVAGRGAEKDW